MSTSPTRARAGRSCPLRALKKEAARANGAKSHGPKTAEGKLASSRNALTHGLTARTVVLQNESAEDYQTELRAYLDHFLPQGKPETDLVHQLAAAQWRLARYVSVEAALLEQKMDDQADWVDNRYEGISDRHRLAIAFESLAGANGSLALLNRYQARQHREYQRILKTLTELQAARLAAESASQRRQKSEQGPPRSAFRLRNKLAQVSVVRASNKSEQGPARPNPTHSLAPVSVVRASNKELPNEPKPAPQLSLDPEREPNIARHPAKESVYEETVGSDRGYGISAINAIHALKAAATCPVFSR